MSEQAKGLSPLQVVMITFIAILVVGLVVLFFYFFTFGSPHMNGPTATQMAVNEEPQTRQIEPEDSADTEAEDTEEEVDEPPQDDDPAENRDRPRRSSTDRRETADRSETVRDHPDCVDRPVCMRVHGDGRARRPTPREAAHIAAFLQSRIEDHEHLVDAPPTIQWDGEPIGPEGTLPLTNGGTLEWWSRDRNSD